MLKPHPVRFILTAALFCASLACGSSAAFRMEAGALAYQAPSARAAAQELTLPVHADSLKFAVIGDSGTGGSAQRRIAQRMATSRAGFPFEFVVMLGDNLYGSERERDFRTKFEEPYKPLLDADVKFYAALGNHDEPAQRFYKPFNMGGEQYYSFKPKDGVRFFALDSNYMDQAQLEWLEKELAASGSDWKIAFFHHPIYSSGDRHGSDVQLRERLEPLFLKYGVDVVLAGHEHFYERIKPQKGIYYFIVGNSAKLREGDVQKGPLTAEEFDTGYSFVLMELVENVLHFQAISDTGRTVDSGSLVRFSDEDKKRLAGLEQASQPPRPSAR